MEKSLLNPHEYAEFRSALAALINRYSMESGSDTPDFILAEYLTSCLMAYDATVKNREVWHVSDPDQSEEIK